SDAYWQLTKIEIHIHEIFMMKCQIVGRKESKRTKQEVGKIKNNGKIVYTYKEATEINISEASFRRAISHLVELGFLDITCKGGQYVPSLYLISDRWKYYGTDKFQKKERIKKGIPKGFIRKKIHSQK
ncbi:hypothetical protein ACFL2X_06905, partial [Candidatus Latescibacterota bacterium]